MFRRKQGPVPVWRERVDRAMALIGEHDDVVVGSGADLTRVKAALTDADLDITRLDEAIAKLNPGSINDELKAALRSRPDPTAPDTPLIVSLRQRHETIHTLQNRRDDLAERVERTLADLDALAAKTVELSFVVAGSSDGLRNEVQGLTSDVDALMRAHQQLAAI